MSAQTREMCSTHLAELDGLGLLLLAELRVGLPLLQKRLEDEHILGAGHRTGSVLVS